MIQKNPYASGSPEWLLFENVIAHEKQALAWAEDARRYAEKSQAARETADKFSIALQTLTANRGKSCT